MKMTNRPGHPAAFRPDFRQDNPVCQRIKNQIEKSSTPSLADYGRHLIQSNFIQLGGRKLNFFLKFLSSSDAKRS